MVSLVVLVVVFVLIAVRQIGRFRLQIWHIMSAGAVAVLAAGQISATEAITSINIDVMLFLLGMFIVGQALEESGYLAHISSRFFGNARSLDALVLLVLFGMGFLSAILMNDTLAIVGTPVVVMLSKKTNTAPRILLLALAFAVTIGSVMSPIGNPQNLLVASQGGLANPFVTFLSWLAVPTVINLLIVYVVLRLFFWRHFANRMLDRQVELIREEKLARLCQFSLLIIIIMVGLKVLAVFIMPEFDFRLTYIAIAACLPIVLLYKRRLGVVSRIDWSTLVFFATMFILMESVWASGVFQETLILANVDISQPPAVMGISVILSQLISNVPLVALYLPMLIEQGAGTASMMALAAGSTIAGNFTILGAASNVIIIQNAERRCGQTLGFWEFVRVGIPLTLSNILVYWLFISIH
ncbi:MAG: SLC13 family permease [Dehalococcoidales bacterium]|jgi:Na+/H+ antiporter NhaD/arsenite permease-like protein|nr:SLC13 family permease [Dehalococcoidales bacterium]MDX9986082.1 SLC13 family permease [Dehalococcoidales bacterium]